MVNDPVIDHQFKRKHHKLYNDVIGDDTKKVLISKGVEMGNIIDGENSISQKHIEFEDALASMKFSANNHMYK